ncbi:type IV conjugative transfer system protein TraE [Klebsiella aerogenes]|uniref:type IV conjugative transfer system protein TraE n=1 Tax=Klebsiella aerogenes TaxID=548 RepID=UPI00049F7034|nr:type IV conjugative transfer system protein TraE [Klebsiella aerogenes]EMF0790049.1 type IV conjugative transfer system protein TraE [Klebsiella aerogenes]KDF14316.1 type IV conjugative transfer system protein TraE [Klebsiella aerogenes MGH 61]RSW42341.1 type IV conjugative transfer system protein TraE [Klebsiella aerogenes]
MDLKAKRLSARYTSLIFLLLLVFFGLSLAGNLVAWLRLDTLINSRQETYIPMGFDTPFTLTRNRMDANYLEQTAESLVFLRYNVSPESVKANHKALLRFFDNEERPAMQEVLASEAQRVIDNNVTTAFYLSGFDTYPASGIVDIHGTVQQWIGNRKQLPEDKTIRMALRYHRGITTIQDFREQVDEKKK